MKTTSLKLSAVNKIETEYIASNITTIDMKIKKCVNSVGTHIKKTYSELEKFSASAGYTLRR